MRIILMVFNLSFAIMNIGYGVTEMSPLNFIVGLGCVVAFVYMSEGGLFNKEVS